MFTREPREIIIRSICVTIWPIKIIPCTATYLFIPLRLLITVNRAERTNRDPRTKNLSHHSEKKKYKKKEKKMRENEFLEKIEFLERKIWDLENYNSSLTDCLRDSYKFSTKLTMMTHQMDQLLTQRNAQILQNKAEIERLEKELAESLNRNNSKGQGSSDHPDFRSFHSI